MQLPTATEDQTTSLKWAMAETTITTQTGDGPPRTLLCFDTRSPPSDERCRVVNFRIYPDAYEYDTEEDECDSEEALMDNEEEFDEDTTEMDLIEYAVEQAILQRTRANGEGERLQQKNSNGGSNSDGGGAGKEGGKDVGKPAQENINPEDLGGLLNAFSVTVATRNSIKLANKQVIYRRDQCTADEIGDSSDTMDREEQDDGMEGTKPPFRHMSRQRMRQAARALWEVLAVPEYYRQHGYFKRDIRCPPCQCYSLDCERSRSCG